MGEEQLRELELLKHKIVQMQRRIHELYALPVLGEDGEVLSYADWEARYGRYHHQTVPRPKLLKKRSRSCQSLPCL